jgi:hypothetical protein
MRRSCMAFRDSGSFREDHNNMTPFFFFRQGCDIVNDLAGLGTGRRARGTKRQQPPKALQASSRGSNDVHQITLSFHHISTPVRISPHLSTSSDGPKEGRGSAGFTSGRFSKISLASKWSHEAVPNGLAASPAVWWLGLRRHEVTGIRCRLHTIPPRPPSGPELRIARLSSAWLQCRPDFCCRSKVYRPRSHGRSVTVQTPRLRRSRFRGSCSTTRLLRLRSSSRLSISLNSASVYTSSALSAVIRRLHSWAGTALLVPDPLRRHVLLRSATSDLRVSAG